MGNELWISIDIETDGQVPGLHSMLSLGAVVFDPSSGEERGCFVDKLRPLPDAAVHEDTAKWWKTTDPAGWNALHKDAKDPQSVMENFERWAEVAAGPGAVACAWKPCFDMAFVNYYCHRYLGHAVFGRNGSGFDIKTATALAMLVPYSELKVGRVPREWFGGTHEHAHDALLDAREQAAICVAALRQLKRARGADNQ